MVRWMCCQELFQLSARARCRWQIRVFSLFFGVEVFYFLSLPQM